MLEVFLLSIFIFECCNGTVFWFLKLELLTHFEKSLPLIFLQVWEGSWWYTEAWYTDCFQNKTYIVNQLTMSNNQVADGFCTIWAFCQNALIKLFRNTDSSLADCIICLWEGLGDFIFVLWVFYKVNILREKVFIGEVTIQFLHFLEVKARFFVVYFG